jgi:hypothetical protein
VSLQLPMRAFACFDTSRKSWVAEAGRYELRVGTSAAQWQQRATVCLEANWVQPATSCA